MSFVKVRHEDGREADITAGEVPFYREMGFEPTDKAALASAKRDEAAAPANEQPLAAANGTDQRLDLILDELRGLRKDLNAGSAPEAEPEDGATVELRGAGAPETTTTTTTTEAPATTTTSTTTAAPKR